MGYQNRMVITTKQSLSASSRNKIGMQALVESVALLGGKSFLYHRDIQVVEAHFHARLRTFHFLWPVYCPHEYCSLSIDFILPHLLS